MKKLLFFIATASVTMFSACQSDLISTLTGQSTESEISLSEIPSAVTEYTANHFPDAQITQAVSLKNSEASTIVTLDSGEELAFDNDHNCLGRGEGKHAKRKHKKGRHGDRDGEHEDEDAISLDSLPAAVKTYLSANYASYTDIRAEKEKNCQYGEVYELKLKSTSYECVKLFFSLTGDFLSTASRVDYSSTPAAVQSYITTNYSSYKVCFRSEKLTSAGGQASYKIHMRSADTKKRVCIAEDGTFICEE